MPGKKTVLIFLCLALSSASSVNIKPRKLTREEVRSGEDEPPITSILAKDYIRNNYSKDHIKNTDSKDHIMNNDSKDHVKNNDSRPEPPEPIKHIAKGSNIEKSPQDAIRSNSL